MLLKGLRILIVDDEYLAARAMRQIVEDLGGQVVGPAGRLEQALALVGSEAIDGAVLDVKLDEDESFPIADALLATGVPVVFATGYGRAMLPERFAGFLTLAKPVNERLAERTLREAFAAGGRL